MFHPGAREYGFGDILVDLTPYIQDVKNQFTAASIAMVSMDGKVGAPIKLLPLTMQGFGIYYNKAYFKKAGLDPEQAPKTAAQFLAACEKLKAAGIVPITVGQTYTIDFLLRCLVANAYGPNVAGLKDGSAEVHGPPVQGERGVRQDARGQGVPGEGRLLPAVFHGRDRQVRRRERRNVRRAPVGRRQLEERSPTSWAPTTSATSPPSTSPTASTRTSRWPRARGSATAS